MYRLGTRAENHSLLLKIYTLNDYCLPADVMRPLLGRNQGPTSRNRRPKLRRIFSCYDSSGEQLQLQQLLVTGRVVRRQLQLLPAVGP